MDDAPVTGVIGNMANTASLTESAPLGDMS